MKASSYMDRAMRARDPRFARVLGRLGYETRSPVAPATAPAPSRPDELTAVRAEYERVIGKRAYYGWDVPTLREKIAAHQVEPS